VYERPRHIKWFIGLQILGAALDAVLVFVVRNAIGGEIGLPQLFFLLLVYVAVKGFFIWKIWDRKNWARLTMLAWFLYTYIQYVIHFESGASLIEINTSLKAVTLALGVVQACSLALLFTRSSNDWFRPAPAKENSLFLPR
jgi:hypothetical protein